MAVRVVLDTNVVVSGFLWKGTPHEILTAVSRGRLAGFSSMPLLDELTRKFSYPKFSSLLVSARQQPADLVGQYELFIDVVVPEQVKGTIVIADPSDDIVVTTALAAGAEFIITGNNHLLALKHSYRFKIVSPALFVRKCPAG